MISYEEFSAVDLRSGTVIKAEHITKVRDPV
jgi:hypothetical protein